MAATARRVGQNASFVDAFVTNSDIAKGTTGNEIIQAGLVSKERVAKSSVPPSIVTDMNDLFANQIKSDDLVAVTVTVDADRGVANQIAPGDHVNIAAKGVPTAEGDEGSYEYILQHVKVLAVGASTAAQQAAVAEPSDDASAPAAPTNSGVLTFEVTKDQALQVINANKSGQIYLVLLAPDQPAPATGAAKAAASGK